MSFWILLLFFALLIMGMPVGFVVGITASVAIYIIGGADLFSQESRTRRSPGPGFSQRIPAGSLRTETTVRILTAARLKLGKARCQVRK